MIKVKLSDNKDIKCFGVLLLIKDMLRDYSIDITDSDDYDYEFVSGKEFVDLSLPLQESIDWGIGQLSKNTVLSEIQNYWYLLVAVLIGGQIGNFLNLKIFSTRALALVTAFLVLFVAFRMLIRFF